MPALNAGMKVPDDIFNYDIKKFTHFKFFCSIQMNSKMLIPYCEWHNAVVISTLTESELCDATWQFLKNRGLKHIMCESFCQ